MNFREVSFGSQFMSAVQHDKEFFMEGSWGTQTGSCDLSLSFYSFYLLIWYSTFIVGHHILFVSNSACSLHINPLMWHWCRFVRIFFRIFVAIIIREIDLKFPFLVASLSGFEMMLILPLYESVGVLPASELSGRVWEGFVGSVNGWQNSLVKPPEAGHIFL